MSVISDKAQLIVNDLVASEGGVLPHAGGTILQAIIQIILQLLGAGGLGICKPPATRIHAILTNPTRRHRRIMERTIEANVDSPALIIPIADSMVTVGSGLSEADTAAMYTEANGL